MTITKFKNGNFNVQMEKDEQVECEHQILVDVCNSIDMDFMLIGNEQSLGNFDVQFPLFNANTNKIYWVSGAEMAQYAEGKKVKLVAQPLDESTKELLEEFYKED